MKRFVLLSLAFALSVLPLCAAGYGPLDIRSWKITAVRPTSFTSLDGSVSLEISNSGNKVSVSDISGILYNKSGEMFIIGSADDLTIPKGTSVVSVLGHGSLSSYVVLLSILRNPSLNPADYTIDITATVKQGLSKPHQVTVSRVPLSTFLK